MDFTVAGIEYENRKELIKKNILEIMKVKI